MTENRNSVSTCIAMSGSRRDCDLVVTGSHSPGAKDYTLCAVC